MQKYLISYFITALIFLSIDAVWLGIVAKKFYFNNLGYLLAEKPNFIAAGIFYLIYVIGIVIFAIAPAFKINSASTALIYGSLFGFFAYLTYDMTNYSTVKNWPIIITFVDILWGTILTGFSACAGYIITKSIIQ
ncbi:DUF2177 family protein [Hyphomicrobiales bacterium]|jgi:uncharacterized membrane protein|nr:DUF2177 family protein [Rhodobiaceae bacterium]MBT5641451.1 DUF2177 family protein [Rhodobiaceae bacterium]MBT6223213.1 DUF2177 family protein [Rhodobiaceae bacterium]MDB4128392.1 DUF2177 family protein [Hyphomicrobiales bacterium]